MTETPRQATEEATRLLDGVRADWLAIDGVRAVMVALLRDAAGAPTTEVGIRVVVDRERGEQAARARDLLPSQLGRFRVQVVSGDPRPEDAGGG